MIRKAIEERHERVARFLVAAQPKLADRNLNLYMAQHQGLFDLALDMIVIRFEDAYLLQRFGHAQLRAHFNEVGSSIFTFAFKFLENKHCLWLLKGFAELVDPDDPLLQGSGSPLIAALREERIDVLKKMLAMETKLFTVSAKDSNGKMALYIAFEMAMPQVFVHLVRAEFDPFFGHGTSVRSVDSPLLRVVQKDHGTRKASQIIFAGITELVALRPGGDLARNWKALQSALSRRLLKDGKQPVEAYMAHLGRLTAITCNDFTVGVTVAGGLLPKRGSSIRVCKRVATVADALLEAVGGDKTSGESQPKKLQKRKEATSSSSSRSSGSSAKKAKKKKG